MREEAKVGGAVASPGIPTDAVVWLSVFASFLIGGAVGLVSVAIFAVILRRVVEKNPLDGIKQLKWLIPIIVGGGLADYFFFDYVLQVKGAIWSYFLGLGLVFLMFGVPVFIEWRRLP